MKIVVIGGSGHLGSFLVPRLVEAGHETTVVKWGEQKPYLEHYAWQFVEVVQADRRKGEEEGSFGKFISDMSADVVIDLICFKPESAELMVKALRDRIGQYIFCGSIWVHGHSVEVPVTEKEPRNPIDDYGIKKAATEAYLLREARIGRFPSTIIHPGHITGPGWIPVNPAGNKNIEVFNRLYHGDELLLPNFGLETLHHVHVDDLAQVFVKAVENRNLSIGESFHAVSPRAITMKGYAEVLSQWFGKKANLKFLPFEEWRKTVTEEDASVSYSHIMRSSICSIEKAQRLLDYRPRYTSVQALYESVQWLVEHGIIH